MDKIDLKLSDSEIGLLPKQEFKILGKKKIRQYTFLQLEGIKAGHSKVKDIIHRYLKTPQAYLTNPIFSNTQSALLFNLRSLCVNEFESNFYASYCPFCSKPGFKPEDSQVHALCCEIVRKEMSSLQLQELNSVSYNDIFSDSEAQFKITKVFEVIIHIREVLRTPAYPGQNTGPDGG